MSVPPACRFGIDMQKWPGRTLGLRIQNFFIEDPERITDVLTDIARTNQDALMVTNAALVFTQRRSILDFAMKNRLPVCTRFAPTLTMAD
jgi:hypothetical protein